MSNDEHDKNKNTIEIEVVNRILKETYLDVANNYDISDLKSDGDKVACVASKFRQTALEKIVKHIDGQK